MILKENIVNYLIRLGECRIKINHNTKHVSPSKGIKKSISMEELMLL